MVSSALLRMGRHKSDFVRKAQPQIDFRFKARIGVGVSEIHDLAMLRHPTRDSFG